jgi:DNA polymerase-3 subunit epsilon
LQDKLARLSAAQRYEQAALVRDRITTVVRACARMQRIRALSSIQELVAARPGPRRGAWELAVVRHGRLAGAAAVPAGEDPRAAVAALRATAEVIAAPDPVLAEETECILRWLEQDGTRLVHTSQPWTMPARGAGGLVSWLAAGDPGRHAGPFAERRRTLPMLSRPARATA